MPERQHQEQPGPADVATDHDDFAVPAVEERSPTGASTKPGNMRATITSPIPVLARHLLGDRRDRKQPDPVAEARYEMRADQLDESRVAKYSPWRRGNQFVPAAEGMNGAWSLTGRPA